MKKRRILLSLLLVFALVIFTGCGQEEKEKEADVKDNPVVEEEQGNTEEEGTEEAIPEDKMVDTTVYIGYPEMGYKEVDVKVYNKVTDERLIAAIADETGWNLNLADPISDKNGGKLISFTEESGFKAGPPEDQKDEYFVYDVVSFNEMMMYSIQKTLDMNLNNGNSIDLYFDVMGNPIEFEDVTVPTDQPFSSFCDEIF